MKYTEEEKEKNGSNSTKNNDKKKSKMVNASRVNFDDDPIWTKIWLDYA